jgi:hypothetical protein
MIQYNISIFIEHAVDLKALESIQSIIMPALVNLPFIDQALSYEILSHQESDSKGYSIQCLISQYEDPHGEKIENLISSFFQDNYPNQFVYFPSQLKRI